MGASVSYEARKAKCVTDAPTEKYFKTESKNHAYNKKKTQMASVHMNTY